MCGIAGFSGANAPFVYTDTREHLDKMSRALIHRGPDGNGIWEDAQKLCGLAHRRLAIVDLSPGGQQPMESHCGRFILVFNGEIYNHKELRSEIDVKRSSSFWRGMSDTESLLEAIAIWGVKHALVRAEGMFSLAVWDRLERSLTLARDRVGEKPLFFTHSSGCFAFASETKALLTLPNVSRKIDRRGLISYLNYGYVSGNGSMVDGINRVPPATILKYAVANDSIIQDRYWEIPSLDRDINVNENQLVGILKQKLTRSVQMQMQADVPLAILLSGGVDSSLVTSLAAGLAGKVRTFTVGFTNSRKYDERSHARIVAQYFDTDHTEIVLQSNALDALDRISCMQDEPLCDSSILPTFLVCESVSRHVKVALGGDGGDELFGGYHAYNIALFQQYLRSVVPDFALTAIAKLCRLYMPTGMKGRSYLTALEYNAVDAAACSRVLYDRQSRRGLLSAKFLMEHFSPEIIKTIFVTPEVSVTQATTRMDFHTYLPDDILAKVDRAAMMSSLEVRAPLLDRQVLEFAFARVPDELKTSYSRRKILLRKLALQMLPAELDINRKQGFSIPLSSWIREGKANILLDAAKALPSEMINAQYVDALISAHRAGVNHGERIFCLAMLSFWIQNYKIDIG
jgi:asparagine synthase (glutamine-hydrolysing)